ACRTSSARVMRCGSAGRRLRCRAGGLDVGGHVPLDDLGGEPCEFLGDPGRRGVAWPAPAGGRCVAEGDRRVEVGERFHLAVEPVERAGTVPVAPAYAGAQTAHAESAHPFDGLVEARVLEVEPLADAEPRIEVTGGRL